MNPIEFEEKPEETSGHTEALIIESLTRIDKTALGVALGVVTGLGIFFATNFLIIKGGDEIGPRLALLGQFFSGYDINFTGSLVGLVYGFITGFGLGWFIAFLRNTLVRLYVSFLKLKGSMSTINDFIDNP